MDFYSLSRKQLQSLCKNNKIPANMTNVAMADALKAIEHVEGLDDILNQTEFNSPENPRTAQRKSIIIEPESSKTTTSCARRATRRNSTDVSAPETPAAPTTRRMAPAVPASQKKVSVASSIGKIEQESAQHVYSTRRSVRLLEKSMSKLSLDKETDIIEPIKRMENTEVGESKKEVSETDGLKSPIEIFTGLSDERCETKDVMITKSSGYEVDDGSNGWTIVTSDVNQETNEINKSSIETSSVLLEEGYEVIKADEIRKSSDSEVDDSTNGGMIVTPDVTQETESLKSSVQTSIGLLEEGCGDEIKKSDGEVEHGLKLELDAEKTDCLANVLSVQCEENSESCKFADTHLENGEVSDAHEKAKSESSEGDALSDIETENELTDEESEAETELGDELESLSDVERESKTSEESESEIETDDDSPEDESIVNLDKVVAKIPSEIENPRVDEESETETETGGESESLSDVETEGETTNEELESEIETKDDSPEDESIVNADKVVAKIPSEIENPRVDEESETETETCSESESLSDVETEGETTNEELESKIETEDDSPEEESIINADQVVAKISSEIESKSESCGDLVASVEYSRNEMADDMPEEEDSAVEVAGDEEQITNASKTETVQLFSSNELTSENLSKELNMINEELPEKMAVQALDKSKESVDGKIVLKEGNKREKQFEDLSMRTLKKMLRKMKIDDKVTRPALQKLPENQLLVTDNSKI